MKILLLGKNGQAGWELQRSLAPLGDLIALDRQGAVAADGSPLCGDISQLDQLAQIVRTLRPDVIVNAAAHTAVDKAESEPDVAHTLNALAPEVLALEAAKLGAWLVHYSTDYVFDGSGDAPWSELDATGPLSVYGATKLDGEQRIAAACPRHLIFRTSWVFAARGGNFAKTMLRLGQERDTLSIINDQFGAPTSAELIADITAHAIRQVLRHCSSQTPSNTESPATASPQDTSLAGIYHLAASGTTTWFDYAKYVLAQAQQGHGAIQIKAKEIAPVPTSAFPTPAQRPHNSRLNTQKLQSTFGLTLPAWQVGVNRMLAEIL